MTVAGTQWFTAVYRALISPLDPVPDTISDSV
jgi:hypothetical protein